MASRIAAATGRANRATVRTNRLTRKANGKTVSESFASAAQLRKAQREVEAFQQFRERSRQLLAVNETICRACPIEETLTWQEKNCQAIQREAAREVAALLKAIFTGFRKSGQFDLEAVEMATRAASHQLGAKVLEQLLSGSAGFELTVACEGCQTARLHQLQAKQVLMVLGPIMLERPYYVCSHCHRGCSPRDGELDVQGVMCSPGVRRMMAVVGSESSFQQRREQLELLAAIEVHAKAVKRHAEAIGVDIQACEQAEIQRAEQWELPQVCAPAVPLLYIEMDGAGIPVLQAETEGRAGKVAGQSAHTREVKLGCVFTQTTTDAEGRPARDEDSASYAGTIESVEAFGLRLYTEAWRRG